eukprot:scaffold31414_cov183-Amphora_coffeaeformis.AAC.10
MDDEDDLFALGGSLMKDLLADLNDDADASFLSLEQLEKELAHLDSKPYGSLPTVTEETPSAASMVVAAQHHHGSLYGDTVVGASTDAASLQGSMDAWSLSLQKFTAASLEEEFLQADSARKAMYTPPDSSTPNAPPGLEQLLSKAEEYDVKEKLLVRPPPGLGASTPQQPKQQTVAEQVAEKLEFTTTMGSEESLPEDAVPPPAIPGTRAMPATPQNSMAFDLPKSGPPTPQTSVTVPAGGSIVLPPLGAIPGPTPQAPPPTPPNSMHAPATPGMIPPTPHAAGGHPMAALTAVPVAMPMPQAWQGSPMPMQPPPRPVYANPHPDAPPIPANALATPFMSVRDISYVVHSILKPILAIGTSPFDYDQVFWRRRGQGLRPGKKMQGVDKLEKEMKSRSEKTEEWSNRHATLGKTAKTNVARPRSLIAQPIPNEGTPGGEEKQRQTLWKARIYCDQAYQAYMQVVEAWESSSGMAVPANLQPHLVKLLRCLGITLKDEKKDNHPAYSIDPSGLSLLLKLAKGRVLLARLLEQALLPPASVQVLLPPALQVSYEAKHDPVDDRVFAAWARVITSLPDLSGTCILDALKVIQGNANAALSSTSRMQAVHGLLRRGSMLAASNPDFAKEWSEMESEFMKILGGM